MNVRISSNWRGLKSPNYNGDDVRRSGIRYRADKCSSGIIYYPSTEQHLQTVNEMQLWVDQNNIRNYHINNIFNILKYSTGYLGFVIDFENENDTLLFKLSF